MTRVRLGFTLIELLVVMGILTIVAGMSLPFFESFQVSTDASSYTTTLEHNLRRGQQQANAGFEASPWGMFFDDTNHHYVLFKGASYATRDTSFDDDFKYPKAYSMVTSFGSEIIFSANSGQASASGTVSVIDPNGGKRKVHIFTNGLIQ